LPFGIVAWILWTIFKSPPAPPVRAKSGGSDEPRTVAGSDRTVREAVEPWLTYEPEALRLLHFTSLGNLPGISLRGVLTRHSLNLVTAPSPTHLNDFLRHDQEISHEGGVCVSIGHPNAYLLHTFRQSWPDRTYIILEFDSALLQETAALIVCPTNAASSEVRNLWRHNPEVMQGVPSLGQLFARNIARTKTGSGAVAEKYSRSDRIGRGLTTDPQAELLFLKNINKPRVIKIHVEHRWVEEHVQSQLLSWAWNLEVVVSAHLFAQRPDNADWKGYRTDANDFRERVRGHPG
jgi:hypothetical protein